MCNPYEVYNQFYGANRKRDIRSSYFTRRLLMTWGYAMTLIQGNLGKVKVTGKNCAKFVSGLYLSYWEMFEVLTLYKDEGVSWLSTKVIWSRSQTEKVHILRLIVMEKQSFKTKAWHADYLFIPVMLTLLLSWGCKCLYVLTVKLK